MKDQSKTKQAQSESERRKVEQALEESEESGWTIVENIQEGYYEVDLVGNYTFFNSSMSNMLGYTEEEMMGMNYRLYMDKETTKKIYRFFNEVYRTGISLKVDYEQIKKDGSTMYVETSVALMRDSLGQPTGFRGIVRDITERKRAEEALQRAHDEMEQRVADRTEELMRVNEELRADITERKRVEDMLRESKERYRSLASSVDSMFLVDRDCRYVFMNEGCRLRFGVPLEDIIGKRYDDFHTGENSKQFAKTVGEVFETGKPIQMEYQSDRDQSYLLRTFSPVMDQEGKSITAVTISSKDIIDLKRMEEELKDSEKRYRELSIVDDLTQLYNSRCFYHQLKMEIDRVSRYEEQPMTLLLLDLDDFKKFNDAYGHVEGDQVLSRFGQVVKRCLRQTDSAYRYGGEEFTILLPMTASADGAITAERIRTEFKKEIFSPEPGQDVHMTVSIGLAQYMPQEELKAFVHRVDQLMYQGKKNGKDRVCSES
jgi:diguanylate cyclase (GGDEF)-like protein/PAS domain S-box-containing protein